MNPDDAQVCRSCGTEILPLLRGRYRVIQTLGQGGFGRTYLALDEDRLKTRCVIKQFSPQFGGTKSLDKAIELFEQEAVRLYELGEHPQIPSLLAYFEQDKRLYLVQQFIEGQNLYQEVQRQGIFNEQKIRELMLGLLPVLKFIHERQVIHRDITPGNIMRRQSDSRLMLIDFGVSKQLTSLSPVQTAGTRIGTEGFSPIEQLRGGRAYPASDLYSLGAVCLHLMTQANPEDLYDPLSGTWIWRDHLSRRGTSVSDRLGEILNKLLKDLVSERYQSADEVLKDLKADSATAGASSTRRIATPPTQPPAPPPFLSHPTEPGKSNKPQSEAPPSTRPVSPPPTASPNKPPLSQPAPPPRSGIRPASAQPFSLTGSKEWQCLASLTGHPSWITSLVISPDQQLLASGSLDDTVKLWSLQSGDLLRTLVGHSRGVNCLAISPDSQKLVSGSDDDSLKIWHLPTGELLGTLTEHSRDINSVAITPNGQTLVSGSEDRTVRIWDLNTGELILTLFGAAAMVKTVALFPDGKTLASGGLDNKVKLWNLVTGELLRTFSGHSNSVTAIAISPDGQSLVSASKDKTLRLWKVATGDLLQTFSGHTDIVNTVVFSPSGQVILSGSNDKTIRVWGLSKGELLPPLTAHLDAVNALALNATGQLLASGGKDKIIKLWQVPTL